MAESVQVRICHAPPGQNLVLEMFRDATLTVDVHTIPVSRSTGTTPWCTPVFEQGVVKWPATGMKI